MNIEKTIQNFKNNGFKVSYFETGKEAVEYLNNNIDKTIVSYGGSMTVTELGLLDSLGKHNEIVSHWNVPEGKTVDEILKIAMHSDVYLTSANGASEDGELVNIDGAGNRVSSTLFGHKKIYFIIGTNKIEENLEKAIWRARNIAAPLNAKRLKRNTPCAIKADKCYNCNSKERICRGLVVNYKKMTSSEAEIIIINEKLGY